MKSLKTTIAGLALTAALAAVQSADAQVDLERFERQLEQIQRDTRLRADQSIPTEQRALLDIGGFFSFNFLAIDDPDQETHILRQSDLNAYARLNIDNVHEFFVRARTSYRDWNTGDDFDGHGDDWTEPTLDRAYYKFDLQRYMAAYRDTPMDWNIQFKGGRQLVHWVNGLTFSQEIDGITGRVEIEKWILDVVAGRTRESTVDIDSSRPGFDGDTNRDFVGGMLAWQVVPEHRPFVYGLVQKDANDMDFNEDPLASLRVTDPGLPELPTRYHYDSFYVGFGSSGNLGDNILYTVELVYQGGETFSNSFDPLTATSIDQTRDDIGAFAADIRLDYLLQDEHRTRLSLELLFATGDDDREHTTNTFGGNAAGTDDDAFNAFGLVNTGLAFAPNVSNLAMVRVGASTVPLPGVSMFKRLQVGTNLFLFNKLDSDAPIDESTSDDSYLGFEVDFYANWQITSDVSLAVRYGVFFPGQAIETDHDARHFFFTGVTYAF